MLHLFADFFEINGISLIFVLIIPAVLMPVLQNTQKRRGQNSLAHLRGVWWNFETQSYVDFGEQPRCWSLLDHSVLLLTSMELPWSNVQSNFQALGDWIWTMEEKRRGGGVKENRLKKWKGLKRKRKDLERTNFKKWPPDPGWVPKQSTHVI